MGEDAIYKPSFLLKNFDDFYIPGALPLDAENYDDPWDAAKFREEKKKSEGWVALLDNKVVGYILCQPRGQDNETLHIVRLEADPQLDAPYYIKEQLLNKAMAKLSPDGPNNLTLEVPAENSRLLEFLGNYSQKRGKLADTTEIEDRFGKGSHAERFTWHQPTHAHQMQIARRKLRMLTGVDWEIVRKNQDGSTFNLGSPDHLDKWDMFNVFLQTRDPVERAPEAFRALNERLGLNPPLSEMPNMKLGLQSSIFNDDTFGDIIPGELAAPFAPTKPGYIQRALRNQQKPDGPGEGFGKAG